MTLLLTYAIGAGVSLNAQPREASRRATPAGKPVQKPPETLDAAARAERIEELEAWLARLVGEFRGKGEHSTIAGTARLDATAVCSHIADGPGVRCTFDLSPLARAPERISIPGGPSVYMENRAQQAWGPMASLLYFGINPDDLEIQLLFVAHDWVDARSGKPESETVNFSGSDWEECHTSHVNECLKFAEIMASDDGLVIQLGWNLIGGGMPMPINEMGHASSLKIQLQRGPATD